AGRGRCASGCASATCRGRRRGASADCGRRDSAMSVEAEVRVFLDQLRRRVRPPAQVTELPPADDALRAVDPGSDLATRFVASAEAAGCRVHRAGPADWTARVARIVAEQGITSVLVQTEAGTALTPE